MLHQGSEYTLTFMKKLSGRQRVLACDSIYKMRQANENIDRKAQRQYEPFMVSCDLINY